MKILAIALLALCSAGPLRAQNLFCFPVEITSPVALVEAKAIQVDLALPPDANPAGFEVREGKGASLPWQYDGQTLTVLLRGASKAGQIRFLTACAPLKTDRPAPSPQAPFIEVRAGIEHQGQSSIFVKTPAATYVYHTEGGGFASLIDRDGNDWISYRPGMRSAGEFRGIPNLGARFHPGYTGERGVRTTIEIRGPVRVRLRSESAARDWSATWDFFPSYARMTLHGAAEPYWFLYEGTPGGALDVDGDFWAASDGARRPVAEAWHGMLPAPEWVYFGDRNLKRVLFLVNHQSDEAADQFWQMESNMTVFGFGRQYRCCGRYMTATPAEFTIGLIEDADFAAVSTAIESAWRKPGVNVGKPYREESRKQNASRR